MEYEKVLPLLPPIVPSGQLIFPDANIDGYCLAGFMDDHFDYFVDPIMRPAR